MEIRIVITRVLVDAGFAALMFGGYILGMQLGVSFMPMDIWFTRMLAGIVGVTAMTAVFKAVRQLLMMIIKSCSIYAVCVPGCNSLRAAFSGMSATFGRTVEILVLNKMIHSTVQELGEMFYKTMHESNCGNNIFQAFTEDLVHTQFGIAVKIGKKYVVKMFNLLDECILSYCYKNPDLGLIDAAIQAFVIFVKNCPRIVTKLFTILMIELIIKVFFICFCIICVMATGNVSVLNFITSFVIAKCFIFILEDAVLEPWIMMAVIREFNQFVYKEDVNLKQMLLEGISSFRELSEYTVSEPVL